MNITYRSFILVIFLLVQPFYVSAVTLLPLDMKSLHKQAKVILFVESLSNRSEQDIESNLVVTHSNFKILDALKGNASGTYSIKQIGGILPGDTAGLRVPGVPAFQIGQRYILFIPAPSKIGFASPVGLNQGMFTLSTVNGTQIVSNGQDFSDLMKSMPQAQLPINVKTMLQTMPDSTTALNRQQRSQMPLTDFMNLIRSMK